MKVETIIKLTPDELNDLGNIADDLDFMSARICESLECNISNCDLCPFKNIMDKINDIWVEFSDLLRKIEKNA